ncbi:MAG: hypothetical protein M3Z66_17175 [Chloroflexota bacterium]|nr:hypothetical protein [Chloroflexota bacterium]
MNDNYQNLRPPSGPFGMGWQGYLIIAIIILGTALFAATRSDWTSMLVSALVLPVIMVALIHVLSRLWRGRTEGRDRRSGPRQDMDLLTFLARTNPLMFLLIGTLSRGVDDDRYQELLRSGPYGMGQHGYLIVLFVFLAPLILTLIIVGVTGQPPGQIAPHFP